MAFNFEKLKTKKKEAILVNPVEIFQKLQVSDKNINDLWLAQGDALRTWHKCRESSDIGIVLNTGAGKTLVGLLIAQSLVNETTERVVYACSSKQLVEQTAEKAKGYGLNVTTYFEGKFNNDLFRMGQAPCITTYQAIFNGKSIFPREDIVAAVFDDAHTAEHLLRDQFSLHIDTNTFPALYSTLVELFRGYHHKANKSGSYDELGQGSVSRLFLVPSFEIFKNRNEIYRVLKEEKLGQQDSSTFAWEHLKDKIDLCTFMIGDKAITITPPFVPVLTLPYFDEKIRRVYLSATLSASDAFTRTFGKEPQKIIAPKTTAGECERLILMPSKISVDEDDIELTKQAISEQKALILVPTYSRAQKWVGFAEPPDRNKVTQRVQEFKTNEGSEKLLLAARYDGMDLPGDTCRVMVIDDLPMGVGLLERYLWEYLHLSNSSRSTIASRIVQSFGRISRGMSDHGVVYLTGKKLVQWLITPKNAAVLPAFLQKQISFGYKISIKLEDVKDLVSVMKRCLNREGKWLAAYENNMQKVNVAKDEEDMERLTKVARSEAMFAASYWNHDYKEAIKHLVATLDEVFKISINTGAWHCYCLGTAYELLGDNESAREMYSRAHSNQKNIPSLLTERDVEEQNNIPNQIVEVERQFRVLPNGQMVLPKNMALDLAHLDGSGSSNQTEFCICALGKYLGLESSRPDNEFGTGPDVLWYTEGLPAFCIEVKTNKNSNSEYQKKEVSQLADHVQWVKDNYRVDEVIPVIVGPINPATKASNPAPEYKVMSLEQFSELSDRLTATLADTANAALPITLRSILHEEFQERRLIWPDLLNSLEMHMLKDLK